MGRRRLFQLSARYKRRLVKTPSEIFEENLNSDLVQAEGENIYLEQVFEEDLEEIEVGSNTSEGSSTETISSESEGEIDTFDITYSIQNWSLEFKIPHNAISLCNTLKHFKNMLISDAVAAHPRTPNYPDEGTVDEEIQKSLKKVADRVGKRMRYKYIQSIITVGKDFRNNISIFSIGSDLTSRPISLPGSSDYSTYVYFNVNSYVYYMIFRINKINYKLD